MKIGCPPASAAPILRANSRFTAARTGASDSRLIRRTATSCAVFVARTLAATFFVGVSCTSTDDAEPTAR